MTRLPTLYLSHGDSEFWSRGPSIKVTGFLAGGSGGATVGLVNIDGLLDFEGLAEVVLASEAPNPEVKDVSGLDFDVTPLMTDEPLMPEKTIIFWNGPMQF